ncbi:Uncharacterized protein TPAR_06003 [Tolypocladium paradoxum]|uniref:Rhodopsin domain-containing protein n=1 Tax=Tolypocladium paradoxum TaxID=94208 RepID=A0A2S4KUG8_9HYPO|nr:Uncharacterized protein TPAR_06003 [Tolypocladium paradoxum]
MAVDPTLVIHWVFSWLAVLTMAARLIWRKIAKQSYNLGDYFTIAAVVCALTRLAVIHVVLIWGTSNMTEAYRNSHNFTDTEIYQRQIGSQLTLTSRVFYNSYLWLQKLVLLDLYHRLLRDLPFEKIIIRSYLLVFFASYVAAQVTTFSECHPVRLYWQVVPDPGECVKAQIQLLTLGILNIVTDAMLLVLPIPIVAKLQVPWRRKIQLYVLFALGVFIIAITIVRLPINSINKDSQVNRTMWASTELLTAAIVVNAPALYGLWNNRRREKSQSSSQRKRGGASGGYSEPQRHVATIGGGTESYQMKPKREPPYGIVQTTEVIVESQRRRSREYVQLPDDLESTSRHSSQGEMLHK